MNQVTRPTLYVDMDCVLADFMAGYEQVLGQKAPEDEDIDWAKVCATKDFFLNLSPMPDLKILWGYVAPYNPVVLTGVPSRIREKGEQDKRAWAKRWLGASVEVICCRSVDKSLYCKPGDILIDDWEKYKYLWTAKGGRWVTHVNAKTTIRELQKLDF